MRFLAQFIIVLLHWTLHIQCSPVRESGHKVNSTNIPSDVDAEFAKELTTSLSNEECLLMYIFFSSIKSSKTKYRDGIASVTNSLNRVLDDKSHLLQSPEWKRFGKQECFSSIKNWASSVRKEELIETDIEMKLVIEDGLVLVNRTDIKAKIASVFNRRQHNEIEEALGEIKRHSSENHTKSSDDMSENDSYEFGYYETFINVLVLCVIIVLIVVKSLISFRSRNVNYMNI